MRRATGGLIHREPARAAAHYASHVKAAAPKPSALDAINPKAMLARHRAAKLDEQIMAATLPAFPNDNGLSKDYYDTHDDTLMAWLVKTGQVEADKAQGTPPSKYWTNAIAL